MLYVLPILLTGLLPGRHSTILITGSALLLTWIGVAVSPGGLTPEALTNRAMASVLLLIIGWLLLIHKESTRKIAAAQQARDESEERLRLAQSAEGFGTFDWDIPGRKVTWSPETERIWGLPVGGFEGTYEHWRRLVHPDDVGEAERRARLALEDPDVSYSYDHRIVRPDGTIRWIHAKATTLRDAAGLAIRMVGVNLDITERKRVEEALRESEERFAKAFRTSPHPIGVTEVATGCCVEVNDACLQLFGFCREEVIGRTTLMLGIWPNPEDRNRLIERLKAGEPVRNLELTFKTKSGDLRHILVSSDLVELSGTLCLITVGNDITARKRAEDMLRELNETLEQRVVERTVALRESEERLRLSQQAGHIGTFEWNVQTGVNMWSPELEALHGLALGEFTQTYEAWQQLVHPDDRAATIRLGEQAFRTGKPTEGEWRVVWPDGSLHWLAGRWQVIKNETGTPLRVIGVNVEITERKRAEDTLRRQQTRLEDLTAKLLMAQESERRQIASELHDDFTQRLAALTIDIQGLSSPSSESDASVGSRLKQAGEMAKQLTTDLQRLAHQLHPSILEHVGLEAAVQEHVEEFETRTGLKTKVQVRRLPTAVPLDRATCLYRVLQESLQNVRKHANANSIVVRLLGSKLGVGLCVHDDGRGFDQDHQTSNGRKGLGLISMEERVGALQGTFQVKTKPGDGTEVHAWVPLEDVKRRREACGMGSDDNR